LQMPYRPVERDIQRTNMARVTQPRPYSRLEWTGLAPWEFEFPFPGSLTSSFLDIGRHHVRIVQEY